MRHDIEFKVGDQVTFNAYGTPRQATVREVDIDPLNFSNEPDERIFYHITGPKVISKCTGKCIQESKYYQVDKTFTWD